MSVCFFSLLQQSLDLCLLQGSSTPPLVLAGSMDGSVAVYDAQTGTVLTHSRLHRKYCVRVRWGLAAGNHRFVTAAWDNTVAIHELAGVPRDAE